MEDSLSSSSSMMMSLELSSSTNAAALAAAADDCGGTATNMAVTPTKKKVLGSSNRSKSMSTPNYMKSTVASRARTTRNSTATTTTSHSAAGEQSSDSETSFTKKSSTIATSQLQQQQQRSSNNSSSRASDAAATARSKRPRMDVNSRISKLQQLADGAKADAVKARNAVRSSSSSSSSSSNAAANQERKLQASVAALEAADSALGEREQEMSRILKRNVDLQQALDSQRRDHLAELDEWNGKHRTIKYDLEDVQQKLTRQMETNDDHLATIARRDAELEQSGMRIQSLEAAAREADVRLQQAHRNVESLDQQLAEAKATIASLETQAHEHEKLRKKLHNTIQELKGNIRVFCRVRNMIPADGVGSAAAVPFQFPDLMERNVIEVYAPGRDSVTGASSSTRQYEFSFDRVFGPNSTQGEVFDEISQLVQSSLDGYNTCIFAYGQTGSGKTYTMEGGAGDDEGATPQQLEQRGMIPRTVEQIFETAAAMSARGWVYEMHASFLEIYNEKIRDLINPQNDRASALSYDIKHDPIQNTISVTNLMVVPVRDGAAVRQLLDVAASNRAVGSTKANERSSRSHSVFTLRISGSNSQTGENVTGMLNLVDLAGSERLANSGATGERLTETKHINKSLSALGDVFFALGGKGSHIPYRNSTLTHLLANSLGGNSKTLMFVNISPNPKDLAESISSLRFASKVNNVEIGTARKQQPQPQQRK